MTRDQEEIAKLLTVDLGQRLSPEISHVLTFDSRLAGYVPATSDYEVPRLLRVIPPGTAVPLLLTGIQTHRPEQCGCARRSRVIVKQQRLRRLPFGIEPASHG